MALTKITKFGIENPTVTAYTPTLAVANNSTSKTSIISFPVDANEMANGDILIIEFEALIRANTNNATQTTNVSLTWGTVNTIISGSVASPGPVNWGDSNFQSAIQRQVGWIRMMRVGSDLHIWRPTLPDIAREDIGAATFAGGPSSIAVLFILSAPSFSTAQTVALQVQHSLASAQLMIDPQQANVYKIAKG